MTSTLLYETSREKVVLTDENGGFLTKVHNILKLDTTEVKKYKNDDR